MTRNRWLTRCVMLTVVLALLALPAAGAPRGRPGFQSAHFSQGAAIGRWRANPDAAPEVLKNRLQALDATAANYSKISSGSVGRTSSGPISDLFNRDTTGLPQNEESITACRTRPELVLGGTNDYRGLLDPQGNFTGWHFSTNGGQSVTNEGLLPPVTIDGDQVPSGGDPVVASDSDCHLFAADLNFDSSHSGVGVYRSNPRALAACPGGNATSCWRVRRAVAVASSPFHFLDKPWFYVGGNDGEEVVWVVYSDFLCPDVGCASGVYTSNSIMGVRCDAKLVTCTDPILISGDQPSIQFGDVTIAPDGRTYVTWEQDNDLQTDFGPPEHMKFWMRVAPAGSTDFGPIRLVANEPRNLGIAPLHANDFRVATVPKNEVATFRGHQRVFVVWEGCLTRPLDTICEEPLIRLRYSDNDGKTWSPTKVLSAGGDNYFPTISYDRPARKLAVAYYTNRFDPIFHNRQDVELVTINPKTVGIINRQRLTHPSNETEADPLLGGFFIGDYFEVFAHRGTAYVHYNANYRHVKILGEGVPVPQQDNYLTKVKL